MIGQLSYGKSHAAYLMSIKKACLPMLRYAWILAVSILCCVMCYKGERPMMDEPVRRCSGKNTDTEVCSYGYFVFILDI